MPDAPKTTPGPWAVHPNAAGYSPEKASTIVWGPGGPGHGSVADTSPHGMPYQDGHQAADALLISAAPELLAACEALLEICGCMTLAGNANYNPFKALDEARAVIAKAKGA